jgi:hypothetical protein
MPQRTVQFLREPDGLTPMEDDVYKLLVISFCLQKIKGGDQNHHYLQIAIITLQELIQSRINLAPEKA